MKNYPMNIRDGVHTIEVTLQSKDFKGHVSFNVGGNCCGLGALSWVDEDGTWIDEDTNFIKNDCKLKVEVDDYDDYWFICELKNEKGDTCEIEMKLEELNDYIVGINIVDFKSQ